jgi:hypothetical protein
MADQALALLVTITVNPLLAAIATTLLGSPLAIPTIQMEKIPQANVSMIRPDPNFL